MEVIEPMKRLLNCHSDWDLAVKACAIMGENNPCWVRTVANALEHGALPQIVVAAYDKLLQKEIDRFNEDGEQLFV